MRLLASIFVLAAAYVAPAAAQLPPDLQIVQQSAGFSDITGIRAPPSGSGRLFVLEQSGRIKILSGSTTAATPFLRLCASAAAGCFVPPGGFTSGGERGLLGLAFHPLYANNRFVYLNYTNGGGNTTIARFQTSAGDPNLADTGTFTILLNVAQDFSNHNGGDIHFGADGYLYVGMGDGGSGGDPCARAQTLNPALLNNTCGQTSGNSRALLGKMLRIDIDSTTPAGSNRLCAAAADGSAPYAIPDTNPFFSTTSNCAEIWASGLRNPFRFSFDRETKDMLIGDVGQSAREEVNLEPADSPGGLNYGWRCREGTLTNNTAAPVCNAPPAFTAPIFDNDRSNNRCSITGGYRYRGPAPTLDGLYFFGDFCEGWVRIATEAAGTWTQQRWPTVAGNIGNIRTFGEDASGNVYVGTSSTVFLITGTVPINTIFINGFEP